MQQNEAASVAPNAAVIDMQGRFDYSSVQPLATRVARQLAQGCVQLVLDMTAVESLSGGALGALLLQQTDAEQLGGSIKLASVSAPVYQTLKTNGFTTVFEIYECVGDALHAFGEHVRVA